MKIPNECLIADGWPTLTVPRVTVARAAEAGGLLEPVSLRSAWTEVADVTQTVEIRKLLLTPE